LESLWEFIVYFAKSFWEAIPKIFPWDKIYPVVVGGLILLFIGWVIQRVKKLILGPSMQYKLGVDKYLHEIRGNERTQEETIECQHKVRHAIALAEIEHVKFTANGVYYVHYGLIKKYLKNQGYK